MTIAQLSVYLGASPLLWLTITVLVWIGATSLARRSGGNAFVNPVLIAVLVIVTLLEVSGVGYGIYFSGTQFIHFLLGPATVALGIPLFRRLDLVKRNLLPMLAALLVGSVTAVVSVVVLGRLFQFPETTIVSIAPKSSTAAVAMAISSSLGGDPSLTAAMVILTGIFGAIIVTPFMNLLRITDYGARGFSVGLASHGIGTARAYAADPVAGLFAGVAMALNAVVTSLVVPLFL